MAPRPPCADILDRLHHGVKTASERRPRVGAHTRRAATPASIVAAPARGLTQSCDRFVGRHDLGEFAVKARETGAVDQIGREDLSVRSYPIEG